jgi:hypothetical protein
VATVCGPKLGGLGEDHVKTSLVGRMLRLRCRPGATVREIAEPTFAVPDSCNAQAGSDVAVIVPVAA